jgi:hypothetical protein
MAVKTAAVGFSPHSGWAAMVVIGGSMSAPALLARQRVALIDGHDPLAKQPYHTVEFMCIEEATGRLDGYLSAATGMAHDSMLAQSAALEERGFALRSAGIVESSGRKTASLSSILASHTLIHGADGDHFRNALAGAAETLRLRVHRIRARDIESFAAERLRQSVSRLLGVVNDLGRGAGPPWGADQKKAALLAWSLLADSSS